MLTFCHLLAPLCHVRKDQARVFIAVGCQLCSFLTRLMWMLLIAACVASIALFQSGHRFGGRYDRLVGMGRIGGAGKLLAAKKTSRENEECKVCLCHNIFSFTCVSISFFIEIKAVQNAMDKRGYDYRCNSDKRQSG